MLVRLLTNWLGNGKPRAAGEIVEEGEYELVSRGLAEPLDADASEAAKLAEIEAKRAARAAKKQAAEKASAEKQG